MAYTFTLDQLTLGDYQSFLAAIRDQDVAALLALIDRYTVGGIITRLMDELGPILNNFTAAMIAQVKPPLPDNPVVTRLLNSALGDKD